MRKTWIAAIAAATLLAGGAGYALTPSQPEPVLQSPTVKIIMAGGHGSGVHIGNGFVITAGHVTEGNKTVTVRTQDGTQREGEVLWYNHASDVSLVRVTAYKDMRAAYLSCDATKVGQAVRLEGNPSGVEFATTWGRVSTHGKTGFENIDHQGLWRVLVTLDLTGAPGVSGGPVYDGEGYTVRGILVSGMETPRGTFAYTYMVPSTEICRVLGRA